MRQRTSWAPAVLMLLAACGTKDTGRPAAAQARAQRPAGDADVLGREIFELVDRAVDYRGSHRGRPGADLRQMGIESLTTNTVRRVVNVQREPVVTVSFRQPAGREIVSCRGDSQVLEQAATRGSYTIMCTASSGDQRPMEVGQ